jgi:H+/gluconate symporter-like permease
MNATIFLAEIDYHLLIGVGLPLFIWLIIAVILLIIVAKKYTLNDKWTPENPNPYQTETMGMPRGMIRGILSLTLLIATVLLQLYAINNLESLDKISIMTGAFELMLAFYFGSKVMHHFAATDKRKTQAVANARSVQKNDFEDPEAIG